MRQFETRRVLFGEPIVAWALLLDGGRACFRLRRAAALAAAGFRPAVVEAGIHYDGLSRTGIRQVLDVTDALLDEVLNMIKDGQSRGSAAAE